jgi:hypothetical protein
MKRSGFSMVEMLAVAAIAIVVAGFSVAGVNRFGRYQASADMGGFNSFLRYSFMQAVRNKEYVRLVIDMEKGSYWTEKSETQFYLFTGEAAAAKEEENEKLIERMESGTTSDPFAGKGMALDAETLLQKAKLLSSEEDLENSDYYNYENFIPERRSLKEILKPQFTKNSAEKKFSKNLIVTGFFAYHTPEVVKRNDFLDSDNKGKEPKVFIYIFPEGRIEPFYLSIGEETADGEESFVYITSDMFLNVKIGSGSFEDEIEDMKDLLKDEDAEGKS